jgi:hypothetical protein
MQQNYNTVENNMSGSGKKRPREETDIDHPVHRHPEFSNIVPHDGNRMAKASPEVLAQLDEISARVKKGGNRLKYFSFNLNYCFANKGFCYFLGGCLNLKSYFFAFILTWKLIFQNE